MILLIDVISPCGIFMNSSTGHHTFCLMRGLLAQLNVGTRAGQVSRQGKLASLVRHVGVFARYSTILYCRTHAGVLVKNVGVSCHKLACQVRFSAGQVSRCGYTYIYTVYCIVYSYIFIKLL